MSGNVTTMSQYRRMPPVLLPSYQGEAIAMLKSLRTSCMAQIAQIYTSGMEGKQEQLASLKGKLAQVEGRLGSLRPVQMVLPDDNPLPKPLKPPTDEELSRRFGSAFEVELSSTYGDGAAFREDDGIVAG